MPPPSGVRRDAVVASTLRVDSREVEAMQQSITYAGMKKPERLLMFLVNYLHFYKGDTGLYLVDKYMHYAS